MHAGIQGAEFIHTAAVLGLESGRCVGGLWVYRPAFYIIYQCINQSQSHAHFFSLRGRPAADFDGLCKSSYFSVSVSYFTDACCLAP